MNEEDNKNEYRLKNEWYNKCRYKYIDLGEFGGNELFVIEGDSLIFKFIYDPKTDFLDFGQTISGGQFLSLIYLFENFLKKLKEREYVFHIAFFDVHKSLWNNRPKLRIARDIIIDHLKSNTKMLVYEFKNWWTEEWKEYLINRQPSFILTGDGSTEHLGIKEIDNYDDDEPSISGIATKNSLKLTIVLRAFMFFSLHHMDTPIALLPAMEFRDSHAYAYVVERGINSNNEVQEMLNVILNLVMKAFEIYDEKSKWLKGPIENFELTSSSKDLLTSQECSYVWSNGGKRIALILLSLTGVLCNNNDIPDFQYLAKIFLLHVIFLDYLPLKLRTAKPVSNGNTIETFLQNFYAYSAKIHMSEIFLQTTQNLKNNLYDFVDTQLFASLIQCQYDDVLNFNDLPNEIKQQFDTCWNLLNRFCEYNGLNSLDIDYVENLKEKFQIEKIEINSGSSVRNEDAKLLPFKHEFFEEYFEDMNLKIPEDSSVKIDEGQYGLIGNVYYDDTTHWHSTKPIITSKSESYFNKNKNSSERTGYQKFTRYLERYAASLNGTQGYYTQNIIVKKSIEKPPVKKKSACATKRKDKIKQDKLQNSLEHSEKYLALEEILKVKNIKEQINLLDNKLEKKDKITHQFTMFRGQFKKLEILMKLWAEHCKTSNVKNDWMIPINILHQVFYIVPNFSKYLNDKRMEDLIEVLNRLKFNNCKDNLLKNVKVSKENEENNENLPSFDFNLPEDSIDLSIEISDARFQMLYAGHLMDRNTNSIGDPRVPFKPDEWQVKVLDLIDKNESALICCPTSSGKTFISFYAMEKILRESDDGILVYVAPTKALVNQVTAEIYGRFRKNYKHGNKTTWGVYTREYRENHEKCQILVTVPQMLEILILSPQRISWSRNIKRIIFDEVHMIGIDGEEHYDHLLLLSKTTPILALSATIGNPEAFHKWMAKSKETHGPPMRLIKSTKRFSDLQQYVYLPRFPLTSTSKSTINLREQKEQSNNLLPINPLSSLSMVILKEHGLPSDMTLVPSQCIQLWDVMKKHMGNNSPNEFNKLDPDEYFKDIGYIVKDDADRYEQELKKAFTNYARDESYSKTIKSTIEELGSEVKNRFAELESTADGLDVYGDEFLNVGILPLLRELSAQDKLPAILFHFNREGCVELALHILEQLELGEKKRRSDDPKYQAIKKDATYQKENHEKEIRRKRDLKTKGNTIQNDYYLEIEEHDSDFTFISCKNHVGTEEFERIIEPARKKLGNNSKLLMALKRGIGVHHSGLSKKYLSAVEILFRRRHLRVVIATGSLALGINMPCKTVVFVGDSHFLTALQYRQMSGRSGRRGFDPIGHVIFFGITLTKIKRLLVSELPNLSGHFPLTTTLVLRSFNLLNQCKAIDENYNYAKDIIKGLFGKSFFCLGKEYLSEQIKHHLRFSIEYLMRENLLDQNGNVINLSAMASHLYYVEPSNFAFSVLFKHGVFHKICSKLKTNSSQEKDKVTNELTIILSYLFSRVKLRKTSRNQGKNSKYPSKVILPPLPEDVNHILKSHNERVLNIYTDYVITFAKNNSSKLGPDDTLPSSLIKIPLNSMDQTSLKRDPLISKLESMATSFVARSPFSAMCSSFGDTFVNLEDLTNHTHSEIFLDFHSIPFIKTDGNINAYICDFFSHGQERALVEANGLRFNEVKQDLCDFRLILLTLVSSLQIRIKELSKKSELEENLMEEEKLVFKGFEMVLSRFNEKYSKTWKRK